MNREINSPIDENSLLNRILSEFRTSNDFYFFLVSEVWPAFKARKAAEAKRTVEMSDWSWSERGEPMPQKEWLKLRTGMRAWCVSRGRWEVVWGIHGKGPGKLPIMVKDTRGQKNPPPPRRLT